MRVSSLPVFLLLATGCAGSGASSDSAAGADGTAADGSDGTGGSDPWEGHAFLEDGRVYNVAHRGGANLWPEHTLVAFQGAADAGADVLEIDLWATSDGVLVVMHDDTVDRTTNGEGAVKGFTFDELRALDAGYHFTTDGGATTPYRGQGLTVPTFDEVIAAHPDALFNVEIKQQSPSLITPVIDAIRAAGIEDQVILGSFYDTVTAEIRAQAPEILTVFGTAEGLELYQLNEDYEDTYEPPTVLFAAPVEFSGLVMTPDLVDKAHRVGVNIHAWTVNERSEMERVLDMGVDGIITDDPVTLAEVLAERGQ